MLTEDGGRLVLHKVSWRLPDHGRDALHRLAVVGENLALVVVRHLYGRQATATVSSLHSRVVITISSKNGACPHVDAQKNKENKEDKKNEEKRER